MAVCLKECLLLYEIFWRGSLMDFDNSGVKKWLGASVISSY